MFEHIKQEAQEAGTWVMENKGKAALLGIAGCGVALAARELLMKEAAVTVADFTEVEASRTALLGSDLTARRMLSALTPELNSSVSATSILKAGLGNNIESELNATRMLQAGTHDVGPIVREGNFYQFPNGFWHEWAGHAEFDGAAGDNRILAKLLDGPFSKTWEAPRSGIEAAMGTTESELDAYNRGFLQEYKRGDLDMSRLDIGKPFKYELHNELISPTGERIESGSASSGFSSVDEVKRKMDIHRGKLDFLNAPDASLGEPIIPNNNYVLWTREMLAGDAMSKPTVLSDLFTSYGTKQEGKAAFQAMFWPHG